MKKIILIYGLIAGTILGAMLFVTAPLFDSGILNMENGMYVGYATMVIALSLVFFGVKSYRDQHQKGVISFGRAFQVGILITVAAAVLYALSWEVAYHTVSKGFSEKMSANYENEIRKNVTNETEMNEKIESTKKMMELYDSNPLVRFGFTLIEVLPVGVVITLLSAALLRRKDFLPYTGE
ncbi:MAG TPA: DUF4199 domain-containing protein [Cyclobacteriaceae bacterium]|nr:DUF4199 domain-containing protein [Cyclobacteriaceae bacterium]